MTEFKETELDERAIKMAKVLSADAVEKAGSGHPGSPVSLAPVAYTLYQHFIKHDPNDPNWEGRDRFILSGGHASLTQPEGGVLSTIEQPASQEQGMAGDANKSPVNQIPR